MEPTACMKKVLDSNKLWRKNSSLSVESIFRSFSLGYCRENIKSLITLYMIGMILIIIIIFKDVIKVCTLLSFSLKISFSDLANANLFYFNSWKFSQGRPSSLNIFRLPDFFCCLSRKPVSFLNPRE